MAGEVTCAAAAPVTVEGSPKTLEGPERDNSEAVKFTAVGLLPPEIREPSEVGTLAIGAVSASAHPLSATSMPLARGGPGSLREKADDEAGEKRHDESLPFSDGRLCVWVGRELPTLRSE